jgi:hypothetical protein
MSGVGCLHLWVKNVKVDNTMLLKVVKNYSKLLAIGLYTNSVVRAVFLLLVSLIIFNNF